MKEIIKKCFIGIVGIVALSLTVSVSAQDREPMQRPPGDGPQMQRQAWLRELGLSPDQIQKIREMNTRSRPLMAAAQRLVAEANRLLDQAIYADEVSEDLVASRLREFQDAQAEVSRLRFENELEMRRVLSAEQLVRFRDLRRRFNEARNAAQPRRPEEIRRGQPPRDGDGPANVVRPRPRPGTPPPPTKPLER
jgi:Spy/CpxP family protein refolding chaperone